MALKIRQMLPVVGSLVVLGTLVVVSGCGKKDEGDTGGSSTSPGKKKSASASGVEGIFDANCSNCHMLNGKGRGRMDLSHEGGQGKTADWIAAHIKNPKTHNPGSKMPAFEGKLAEGDIKSLADHLASLK